MAIQGITQKTVVINARLTEPQLAKLDALSVVLQSNRNAVMRSLIDAVEVDVVLPMPELPRPVRSVPEAG